MITLSCSCGGQFEVDSRYAGLSVACPHCDARTTVPQAEIATAVPVARIVPNSQSAPAAPPTVSPSGGVYQDLSGVDKLAAPAMAPVHQPPRDRTLMIAGIGGGVLAMVFTVWFIMALVAKSREPTVFEKTSQRANNLGKQFTRAIQSAQKQQQDAAKKLAEARRAARRGRPPGTKTIQLDPKNLAPPKTDQKRNSKSGNRSRNQGQPRQVSEAEKRALFLQIQAAVRTLDRMLAQNQARIPEEARRNLMKARQRALDLVARRTRLTESQVQEILAEGKRKKW